MKWTTWVAGAALFCASFAASAADEYTFVVINSTGSTISRLLVSEDGASWRPFNIGGGLRPGGRSTMVWDESTNNSGCEWSVKAVYSDGSESEPADFDFCEAGLELEFSE